MGSRRFLRLRCLPSRVPSHRTVTLVLLGDLAEMASKLMRYEGSVLARARTASGCCTRTPRLVWVDDAATLVCRRVKRTMSSRPGRLRIGRPGRGANVPDRNRHPRLPTPNLTHMRRNEGTTDSEDRARHVDVARRLHRQTRGQRAASSEVAS